MYAINNIIYISININFPHCCFIQKYFLDLYLYSFITFNMHQMCIFSQTDEISGAVSYEIPRNMILI